MRRLLLFIFAFLIALALAKPASAALVECNPMPTGETVGSIERTWIKLQIPIPGISTPCTDDTGQTRDYIQDVGAYIAALYKFLAGAIGIIATLMVFYGGLQWLTAAGNASRVKDAKETVFAALIAVVIALGSYLLLYTINPKLVNLRPPSLVLTQGIEQRFAMCPTVQTCQSGDNVGKPCVLDSDCGGSSGSGACGFGVDIGTALAPACGQTYAYQGKSAGATTCTGKVCFDDFGNITNDVCTLGTKDDDGDFTPKTVGGTVWGCTSPQKRCESITDDEASPSDCPNYSVSGVGKCKWVDFSILNAAEFDDRCAWFPVLKCDDGWTRVGCGDCTAAGVSDDSCRSPYKDNGARIDPSSSPTKCTSSAGETVYAGELNADQIHFKSICCKKAGSNDLQCRARP